MKKIALQSSDSQGIEWSTVYVRDIKCNRKELDLLYFIRSILAKCVFNDFDSCANILKLEDLKILFFFVIVF